MLRLEVQPGIIWGGVALAILLSLPLLGCGGDADDAGKTAARTERVEPRPTVTLPPDLPPPPEGAVTEESPEEGTVEARESDREVTFEEAEGVYRAGRYREAIDLFVRYSERRPDNPWGHYMAGLSAWKAGEPVVAEEAFRRALAIDPGHVKSLLNLSRVLLETDRAEEALQLVERAIELDDSSGVPFRLRGRAYHVLGRSDEAIDSYRQALLRDDADAWSMNNLGLIYIEQERFSEALPPLARAVEIRDDVPTFLNNLGVALERTGHFRAAEDAYYAALLLEEGYEKARGNFDRVTLLEEDPDLAAVDLAELARSFVDEVESWHEAVAHRSVPEFEVEPVVVTGEDDASPPDSAGVGTEDEGGGDA